MNADYTYFDQTSDLGIEVVAKNLQLLFIKSATSLTDLLVSDFTPICYQSKIIEVTADTIDLLLREWLAELLYIFYTENYLANDVNIINIKKAALQAELNGGVVDLKKYPIQREIKSVTYHQLGIKKSKEGYRARFVLDV